MSPRATSEEYERIDLRAHSLLADVPLHDVWMVELPGGRRGLTIGDLRPLFSAESLTRVNPAVSFLFGLRTRLGRIFGWDREPPQASSQSFVHKLSDAERSSSLVKPGSPDGPFKTLFAAPHETISEIVNSTVHAFSVFALIEQPSGYRLYWAIYVRPIGRITGWYMHLIDPFRRFIIYPAILRYIRACWKRDFANSPRS